MSSPTRGRMRSSSLRKRRQLKSRRAPTSWEMWSDMRIVLQCHTIPFDGIATDSRTTRASLLSKSLNFLGGVLAKSKKARAQVYKWKYKTEGKRVVPRRTASKKKTTKKVTTTNPRRSPRLSRQPVSGECQLHQSPLRQVSTEAA